MIIKEKVFTRKFAHTSPAEDLAGFIASNSIPKDHILSITYRTPYELCLFYDTEGLTIYFEFE